MRSLCVCCVSVFTKIFFGVIFWFIYLCLHCVYVSVMSANPLLSSYKYIHLQSLLTFRSLFLCMMRFVAFASRSHSFLFMFTPIYKAPCRAFSAHFIIFQKTESERWRYECSSRCFYSPSAHFYIYCLYWTNTRVYIKHQKEVEKKTIKNRTSHE